MLSTENDTEFGGLNKYDKCIMQLYKAFNRQYRKTGAIDVAGNLIYKEFGYKSLYFNIVEDGEMILIKNLSYKYSGIESSFIPEVFNLKLPADKYKKVIYLEGENIIKKIFPHLDEMVSPNVILSTPVFSQDNKLIGLFMVYDIYKRKMEPEFKNLIQLAVKEFVIVFSRIEKHNLMLENMLDLTALENILLYSLEYNPKKNQIGVNNPLQKIVSELSDVTGMERCILVLAHEDGEFVTPCYSNYPDFDAQAIDRKRKYFSNKLKSKSFVTKIVVETKQPIVVYDALTDPRCSSELAEELGIYSIMFLPILDIKEKPLGVLCLHNGRYETFSKRQLRFFGILARHLGLIISNIDYIDNLKSWSKYDGLTDLLNRRTFENIYGELYDAYRFSEEKFSILMVDIDDFKSTNDIYGHQIGDKVLKSVAKCIKQNVREKDIVARYGGEEVIIILKGIDKVEAKIIANRIRHSISALSVNDVSVTVSIGVSTFGVDSYNKENLIYIADKCLYEAKSIGKNQVVSR